MAQSNTETGIRIQEKFHFYLIGLTFTVLGLSIQTAKFGTCLFSNACELAGWLTLLISGISGLSRLEGIPQVYRMFDIMQGLTEDKKHYERARKGTEIIVADSEPLPRKSINDRERKTDEVLGKSQQWMEQMEEKGHLRYRVHKFGLVLGLLLLIIARGFSPAAMLLQSLF